MTDANNIDRKHNESSAQEEQQTKGFNDGVTEAEPQASVESPECADADLETSDVSEEQQLIGELQEQVLALKDQALRAQAEMENIRRRSHEEVAKARKFGTESFSESLIPVRDSLEAALAIENQSLEAMKEGMETILRQLTGAFERNHLKEISPAVGDKFDPNLHQAISSVPNPDIAANGVMQLLQKGYTISDRVLRPALVIVSAG